MSHLNQMKAKFDLDLKKLNLNANFAANAQQT